MGVYIKDMEMPSGCISCPFKSHGTIDEFKYYCDMTGAFVGSWESKKINQRHKDCPLVEEKTGNMTELVRCRECVMWDDSLVLNGKKRCLNMSFCTDGDFYCGWGSKE